MAYLNKKRQRQAQQALTTLRRFSDDDVSVVAVAASVTLIQQQVVDGDARLVAAVVQHDVMTRPTVVSRRRCCVIDADDFRFDGDSGHTGYKHGGGGVRMTSYEFTVSSGLASSALLINKQLFRLNGFITTTCNGA